MCWSCMAVDRSVHFRSPHRPRDQAASTVLFTPGKYLTDTDIRKAQRTRTRHSEVLRPGPLHEAPTV